MKNVAMSSRQTLPTPPDSIEDMDEVQVRKVNEEFKDVVKRSNVKTQLVQIGFLALIVLITLTLILTSASFQVVYILLLLLIIVQGLALQQPQQDIIAKELVAFAGTWTFWILYSFFGFSTEDHALPIQSILFHLFITFTGFFAPVGYVIHRINDNIPRWKLLLILAAMFFISIIPFDDNNAFHSLRDSLIRVLGGIILYAIIFYNQQFCRPPLTSKTLRIAIQTMYVFYGEFWSSCLFFIVHVIFHIYTLATVIGNLNARVTSHEQRKVIGGSSRNIEEGDYYESQLPPQQQPQPPVRPVFKQAPIRQDQQQQQRRPPPPASNFQSHQKPTPSVRVASNQQQQQQFMPQQRPPQVAVSSFVNPQRKPTQPMGIIAFPEVDTSSNGPTMEKQPSQSLLDIARKPIDDKSS